MKNTTLFLPGFHLATLRRTPRSTSQKLAEELARIRRHTISQLGDCFSNFIPTKKQDTHKLNHQETGHPQIQFLFL